MEVLDFRLIPIQDITVLEDPTKYPYGINLIKAPAIWEKYQVYGEDIVVAVIDTGVDVDHPELKPNIIGGRNFTTDYNGDPNNFRDNHYHGTHVSGIIAATINDGIPNAHLVGVSPRVKILALKVLTGDGKGNATWITNAINYAIDWRGPRGEKVSVINMSLGGPTHYQIMHDAIKRAVANDILVVCSAGNNGDGDDSTIEFTYPGSYPEVVQVGAVDQNKKLAPFSNTNDEVDLVAPGVNIISAYPGAKYAMLSGTSMAAPHVTGAAALLINVFEKKFGRRPSEAELYAQIIKKTVAIEGYSRRGVGNGILDLMVDENNPPAEPPKEEQPYIERIYSIWIKQEDGYHKIQLGAYANRENALKVANMLANDLSSIKGVGVRKYGF